MVTTTKRPKGESSATKRSAAGRSTTLKRETTWVAPAVEGNLVHRTLNTLWAEIADERRAVSGRPRSIADAATMRTRTINLIVVADDRAEAERIEQVVTGLAEFFPSRTMILIRVDAGAKRAGLHVRVAVEERPTTSSQPPVRFETVAVSAGKGREELLASVAAPILVPELPDFVWFPGGSFATSPLLQALLPITDRLVVDTSTLPDPSSGLRYLAELVAQPEGERVHLSDIAWTRLTPWRQMVAQFFDQGATMACLEDIELVTIEYGEPAEQGRSGITAGLLMAGWLCTRLGWRAPGEELVRTRDGWKLTLRAGERGRSREVIVMLVPAKADVAGPCIGSIELVANGASPGRFRVHRVSEESVESVSEAATHVSRVVYLRNLDDARLLSLELRVFGADPIYTQALGFAANLWPEGVQIS